MDIRKGNGSSVLYNIRGDDICEGRGSTPAFNIQGKNICEGRGSTPVANATGKMSNVEIAVVFIALGYIRT